METALSIPLALAVTLGLAAAGGMIFVIRTSMSTGALVAEVKRLVGDVTSLMFRTESKDEQRRSEIAELAQQTERDSGTKNARLTAVELQRDRDHAELLELRKHVDKEIEALEKRVDDLARAQARASGQMSAVNDRVPRR